MQEPKDFGQNAGQIGTVNGDGRKRTPISSVKIERLPGSPYLRVTPINATPSTRAAPKAAPIETPPPAPAEPAVDAGTSAFKPAFARSPVATVRAPRMSPIVKLGMAAAALTVLIVTFLMPTSGPKDISEVTPLAATIMPVPPKLTPKPVAATAEIVPVVVEPEVVKPAPTIQAIAPPDTPGDFIDTLTANTVAALRRAANPSTQPANADLSTEDALARSIAQASALGQSPAQIDSLRNDTLQDPTLTLPKDLIQPDGRVDTAGIISILTGK